MGSLIQYALKIFWKTNIFTPCDAHVCAYQEVKKY